MLTLRKTKPGFGLDVEDDARAPEPMAGQVTVHVENAGICGSEVGMDRRLRLHGAAFAGDDGARIRRASCSRRRPGVVIPFGTAVPVMPGVDCGVCANCTRGDRRNCLRRNCLRRSVIGLTRHGGFARYVTVPAENCLPLREAVDTELGALTEPLGVGCQAVVTVEVGLGDIVLVMGPGPIR
jgi:threonine dehydrogenase-like Zn-dependent dehydrogenase